MTLESKVDSHVNVVDTYVNPTASYAMSVRDYVVRPAAAAGGGAIVITLPNVSEAAGRFYSILARDADTYNSITIQDNDESEYWTDITMDGPGDRVLLYSDGLCWHTVTSVLTASATTVAPTTA